MREPDERALKGRGPRLGFFYALTALVIASALAFGIGTFLGRREDPPSWSHRHASELPALVIGLQRGGTAPAPGASWAGLPDGSVILQITEAEPDIAWARTAGNTLVVHLSGEDSQPGATRTLLTPPQGEVPRIDSLQLEYADGSVERVESATFPG